MALDYRINHRCFGFGTKKLRNVGKDLGGAVHDFKQGLNEGTDGKDAKKDEVIEHKKDEDKA